MQYRKRFWRQFVNPHFYLMVFADAVLFALALYVAYLIRFDGHLRALHVRQLHALWPLVVPLHMVIFMVFGRYRGMWRYTGLHEITRTLQASLLGMVSVFAILVLWKRFGQYSRSVILMSGILTFLFTGGLRIAIRVAFARRARNGDSSGSWLPWRRVEKPTRVAIIGAGDAGEALARDILYRMSATHEIVRFLDDDQRKIGRTLHGIPVHGPIADLQSVIAAYEVNEVLIAIPSASGDQTRRIVEICEEAGVPFKTLPGIDEIIDGRVTIQSLREVDYQDLLGRDPVNLDTEGIADYIRGETVLVTGAGGSIGSELCRQIIRYKPAKLILFDASEFNLYHIEMEMVHQLNWQNYEPVLGRVQDQELVRHVLAQYRPSAIFHAAACKHVPILEGSPWEAVHNNVVGSRVMMDAAQEAGVARFVLVSTDKAVSPTNVMGASKRTAELLLLSRPSSKTRFMAVRFGNVVGSSGSVIPLFHEQIRRGGPVTVTHPDITRYFMTIPEASQLILQAGGMGEGGEIFVLDMGKQVRILDMARDLIRLAGKEPEKDIAIQITGLRPGEKMREELWMQSEKVEGTVHPKIRRLQSSKRPRENLAGSIQRLQDAAARHDTQIIRRVLAEIVPEYKGASSMSAANPAPEPVKS